MKLTGGPLAYESQRPPEPLSEEEEAALAFAACGVTGFALAELPYDSYGVSESGGGNIMTHFVGRTVASGDAMHDCTVFVINDSGAWLLKQGARPNCRAASRCAARSPLHSFIQQVDGQRPGYDLFPSRRGVERTLHQRTPLSV
jgi:hypothetical protein